MVMYGIYNAETLELLINTVHCIHNTTSANEKLFAGQESSLTLRSLYGNAQGIQQYSINSLLYLRTIKDQHVLLYKECITQLHNYAAAVRILAKGYLPISLTTPLKLKEILSEVRNTVSKRNPDYDLVIKGLNPYYDMKLVKSKLCRGIMFSNAVKIMVFISDIQYYVPIKLCKTAESIHQFKFTDMLNSENVNLN